VLVAALCVLSIAACTSTSAAPPNPDPRPHPSRTAPLTPGLSDWTTFGHDAARTGRATAQHFRPDPGPGRAVRLDGPVYGQPLIVGDTVFAATENDSVYALSAADGSIFWRAHLAEPFHPRDCGNIQPLGITGTPVYDHGRLFVVAEDSGAHHVLTALDAASGTVTAQTTVDPPGTNRADVQQRPALSVVDGSVQAAFGGLFGDCGTYTGAVATVRFGTPPMMDGGAGAPPPRPAFEPPVWYPASTSGRGGVWAPGGAPTLDGRSYYSVGNGNAQGSAPWDGSDSVVALTADGRRAAAFAPATWAADNAADADLGSMNPALVGGHVLIAGKAGVGYLLDPADLGGGVADAAHSAPAFEHCHGFGAAAVEGAVAYVPCAEGVTGIRVGADGAGTVLWHATAPATGSPSIGSGFVWSTDPSAGVLYALDAATGAVAGRTPTGALPHFASPAISADRIVLGTSDGAEIFSEP
jgi:polyvinyl alcohol dehydrogenase (cytochrome)